MRQRLRFAWILFAFLLALVFSTFAHAQTGDSLRVFDIGADSTEMSIKQARRALKAGQVVRAVGGDPGRLKKAFGLPLTDARPTEKQEFSGAGKKAINPEQRLSKAGGEPTVLRVVAVRQNARGEVHQYLGYTSAKDSAPETSWVRQFDRWLQKEVETDEVETPQPPDDKAWTTLLKATTSTETYLGNQLQLTMTIYRLDELEAETDWYMVLTDTESIPNFTDYFDSSSPGVCNFFDQCDWHMYQRGVGIGLASGTLVDHGPTGTITTETAGFNIGGSLNPAGAGASASYSQSWSQPSITTLDLSTTTFGQWEETVGYEDSNYDPYNHTEYEVGFATFVSYQGAIFSVTGGANAIAVQLAASATFLQYQDTVPIPPDSDVALISLTFETGPPVLAVGPTVLSIPAGGSGYFGVTAYIPNSLQGLSWNLSTNQQFVNGPFQSPFSSNGTVQINVEPGTPVGSIADINVDTDPPYGAPAVEGGPLIVKVVVVPSGSPAGAPPAGVLLTGGNFDGSVLQTAAVYDLASASVLPVGNMTSPREGHTATLLSTGNILLVGGSTTNTDGTAPGTPTESAEIYDPGTAKFSAVGNLATARYNHQAVLLKSGKVLIVGGYDASGNALASAEIYDPATQSFKTTGSMQTARGNFGATAVDQGSQVLVYGGEDTQGKTLATAELWDVTTGTFSPSSSMATAQADFPQPADLSASQVVIVGGFGSNFAQITSEQILDPANQAFASGSALNTERVNHTLTALANGAGLLVTGGQSGSGGQATAELRGSSGWSALSAQMTTVRILHTATLLPDTRVFVAGGETESGLNSTLASTEFYDPATQAFSAGPSMSPRSSHTATAFTLKNVPTTTTLTAGTPTSTYGQQVAFTATVIPATATGSVTFKDGTTTLGTVPLQSNGQATFYTAALAGGPHSITVSYSGDTTYLTSTSVTVTQTVNAQNTTTALNASPNPAKQGDTVNLSATVLNSSGTLVNQGTVQFLNGNVSLGTQPVQNGTATLTVPGLAVGNYSLVAAYSGDTNFNPSTKTLALTVNVPKTATNVSLVADPGQSTYGQPVTFSATVKSATGTGQPTGLAKFFDGTTYLASVPLGSGGVAALTKTDLTVGAHSLSATYEGDSNFTSGTSTAASATVGQAVPGVTLTSSLNPSQQGQAVSFVATLSFPAGAVNLPTGQVRFFNGSAEIGTVQIEGNSATLAAYSTLPTGTNSITATYIGDTNYAASTSNVYSQVVKPIQQPTTTSLGSSVNPSAYGQPVAITATVTSGSSSTAPTGQVRFAEGQNTLGTSSLVNGKARLATAALNVGSNSISAEYLGDSNYLASSSFLTQTVNPAATTTSLVVAPNPSTTGQTITLTAGVSAPVGQTLPPGTVQFYDNTVQPPSLLGTAQVQGSGVVQYAVLRYAALPVGTHSLGATYTGADNYRPSTSNTVTQVVEPSQQATATALLSSLNPSLPGAPVTFTATVSATTGSSTPIGRATFFKDGAELNTVQLANGVAELTVTDLTEGDYAITAKYLGTRNYSPSTSEVLTQDVLPSPPAGSGRGRSGP